MPVTMKRQTIAMELRRARQGRQRRRIIARLVAELAGRLWAPSGEPYWRTVAIPPTLVVKLRGAKPRKSIDPAMQYRLELAGGRELVAMCRGLIRLADAQTAGDLRAVERALRSLSTEVRP